MMYCIGFAHFALYESGTSGVYFCLFAHCFRFAMKRETATRMILVVVVGGGG
jgi:hypothetical protein